MKTENLPVEHSYAPTISLPLWNMLKAKVRFGSILAFVVFLLFTGINQQVSAKSYNFGAGLLATESHMCSDATCELNEGADAAQQSLVLNDFLRFSVSDLTRVESPQGWLKSFFKKALTSLVKWSGKKLTNWVVSKIDSRATTYSNLYNQNTGVQKAYNHWNDLMGRSGAGYYQAFNPCTRRYEYQYSYGREPDHDPNKYGFQDSDDCPICSKQMDDLNS